MNESGSKIVEFDISNHSSRLITIEDMVSLPADPNKLFWIHCDLNDAAFIALLTSKFPPPEIVFECLNDDSTMPIMRETDEYLTIKIQSPLGASSEKKKNRHHTFSTLVLHLTHHYCLTFASGHIPALQEFSNNYQKSISYAKTPCFILFLILDNVLNDYAEILYLFEANSDDMDFNARASHHASYRAVMNIKKELIRTKRYTAAIRDILMRVSGRKMNVVSEQCRRSLHDLYGHSQVIVSECDSVRELLNGLLEQIDNSLIHRMSESMKVLTAFAAIFMPLTLIAGIYGMNFNYMPELQWHFGYFFSLSLMFVVGMTLYLIFKHMKWI
jgi:magnesium/cobalt transport protein CorA